MDRDLTLLGEDGFCVSIANQAGIIEYMMDG